MPLKENCIRAKLSTQEVQKIEDERLENLWELIDKAEDDIIKPMMSGWQLAHYPYRFK